jgi:hypothetical protein
MVRDPIAECVGNSFCGARALVVYMTGVSRKKGWSEARRSYEPSTTGFPFFAEGRKIFNVGKP